MLLYRHESAAAAQSDNELVAAPGANRQLEVWSLVVSTDVAQKVTFESGTDTAKLILWMAANSTVVLPATDEPHFTCDVNDALTYTSAAAGNIAITVGTRQVRNRQ